MGISRSNAKKRKSTGGKKHQHEKKRKHNSGRPSSNTKIGDRKVKLLRVRGGNIKRRALRLNYGSFTLKSHNVTKRANILQVMYHPTNNELMRTNTLTKSAVVKIDNGEFRDLGDGVKDDLMYARITSRPGQDGAADGYLLEGDELVFYMAKFKKRKGQ